MFCDFAIPREDSPIRADNHSELIPEGDADWAARRDDDDEAEASVREQTRSRQVRGELWEQLQRLQIREQPQPQPQPPASEQSFGLLFDLELDDHNRRPRHPVRRPATASSEREARGESPPRN